MMDVEGMNKFCGSEFWNVNLTWYTEDPSFTSCFQNTVLFWIPCVFLWAASPVELYFILNSKSRNIPWNWLNISKLIVTLLLIILAAVDFIYATYQSYHDVQMYPVHYYVPAIKFFTFILTFLLVVYNCKYGLQTSGVLFLFWLILLFCGVVQYRDELVKGQDGVSKEELYSFITYMIHYPLVVIMFLLNCIADAAPRFSTNPPVENPCPEPSVSFFSKIWYTWFDKMAWEGFRRPLETSDMWSLNPEDTGREIIPIFDKYWENEVQKNERAPHSKASFRKTTGSIEFVAGKRKSKSEASLLPTLIKGFWSSFLVGSFLKLMDSTLAFASPLILNELIAFVGSKEPLWKGYMYAFLLFFIAIIQSLILAKYLQSTLLVGMRIRTALVSAIYRKSLKLSNAARKESPVGEIINLMSVDAHRFLEVILFLNDLWGLPIEIGVSLYFLWAILGPSVIAGLAVMIFLIPVNIVIARKAEELQLDQMKNKDKRVKFMNEILNGMKVLKLYAWEPSFEKQVIRIRNKEIKLLTKSAYLQTVTSFVWSCAPFVVSLVTFGTYVLMDENNVLDAQKAFVALSLLNVIRFPLAVLPMIIISIVQAGVSIKRMNKFMNAEELDPNCVSQNESEKNALVIENGTFSWGPDDLPCLKNINLQFSPGSLVAVVGAVGSGKSSLLSAFLGEMEKINGRVNTKGSIAYVPQQAWIQNATVKDNIVFGNPVDKMTYLQVVEACALKPDLEMLQAGDQTEIGEKGINLSGGQKQRVSLARAVYCNADVYFLDDPLSAVDSHVGKHIFENVIGCCGLLKEKTRVLVTHAVTFLPDVDLIVVLKDGEVTELGTYKQLMAKKGAFADFLVQHLQEVSGDDETSLADLDELKQQLESSLGPEEFRQKLIRARSRISESHSDSGSAGDKLSNTGSLNRQISADSAGEKGSFHRQYSETENLKPAFKVGEKLIEAEETAVGGVKWHVYAHYFLSIGPFVSFCILFFNTLFQSFTVGANIWLSEWATDQSGENGTMDNSKRDMYLGVYGAMGGAQIIAIVLSSLAIFVGGLNAAHTIHNHLLTNMMRLPLAFFDVTPLGRILNRFSRDVDTLDNTLPMTMRGLANCLFTVVATLVVISFTTPIFMAVVVPLIVLYYFIQRYYVATSRQLQRIESITRSPIYSHFGESITGASSIRAYGVQPRFIKESERKVDFNQMCYYPRLIANRWLAVRLEMVGNLVIFFAALFAVLDRDTMNPGLVGLSISCALQVTGNLTWLVRMASELENNIVCVERIKEYSETRKEAPWTISSNNLPRNWPEEGKIEFKDYQVRYREGLELVLKGISFDVKGGEKIGIVGRTGAGKSSLTLGLFRIIEAAHGSILIDGIDVSKLGLHTLRSHLTIIPQDPVLFSGTLRINLDPFNNYSDEDVWKALEHAHLKNFVKGLSAGLSHEVVEGGENLSVGQRQLICLARALLRKTKVLILDEATAAVDLETDDLIQKTIRTEFEECTVLTIAHRLNTIMDSNRVVVLDKGVVIEYDPPEKLLQNRNSVFFGMAKDAGLA